MFVELTQPYTGFDGQPRSRASFLNGLGNSAMGFAKEIALGLKRANIAVADPSSTGFTFTGMDAPADRADPADASLAQPFFSRMDFNNPETGDNEDAD
jgi:hypothetical protein